MKKLSCLILLLSGLGVSPAFAQLNASANGLQPDVEINLQPNTPRPGEEVTATLNDYRSSSFGADITWQLNGEVLPSAQNTRSTTFTAGPLGTTDRIEVVLTRNNGQQEVIGTAVDPLYIDIVIEPQTRTPNFYRGRSLPSIGSLVNATALVNDGTFREDLVYTWRMNRTVLGGGPVRTQNQVTFPTPRGETFVLSVEIAEPDGSVIGRRAIRIPSVFPELRYYEVSTLYGISRRPINDGFTTTGNTLILRAEPYHLDSRVFNNPDVSDWSITGFQAATVGRDPYEVTITPPNVAGNGNGSAGFHVRSLDEVLQGDRSNVSMSY